MPEKDAMRVIVNKTYRKGMRLMAKMAMLKQSMTDMRRIMMLREQKKVIEDRNKVAAKD